MAIVNITGDFDFHAARDWSGSTVTLDRGTATATLSKGDSAFQVIGNLGLKNGNLDGFAISVGFESAGHPQWSLEDGFYDAGDLQTFAVAPGGTQIFYGYLFAGNDTVESRGLGSVLDGYAGTNTISFEFAASGVAANLAKGAAKTAGGTDHFFHFASVTGSAFADVLTGDSGANILDGGAGADVMRGGQGDDTYIVDDAGDSIWEARTGGTDSVRTPFSTTLAPALENLTLTGTAAIDGIGNSRSNLIIGNAGANLLDGGAGADHLIGGAGNDTYILDNLGDTVDENYPLLAGSGYDTIRSSVRVYMPEGIEHVVLTGTGNIDVVDFTETQYGSAGARIDGNDGDNILDARADRIDTLAGGKGDDTYLVNGSSSAFGSPPYEFDRVVEKAGEGYDTIQADRNYALPANFEALVLSADRSFDLEGTGNALDNKITGHDGRDWLDGKAGDDVLIGLGGEDRYFVDSSGDTVIEAIRGGYDIVMASASFRLGDFVEDLWLVGKAAINGTGNSLDNTITGNGRSNVLDGGAGADRLEGGAGDDTYVIDSSRDIVREESGRDTVLSSASYALSDDIENLRLIGQRDTKALGNSGDNVIQGNVGNNVLDGGAGTDIVSYANAGRVNVDMSLGQAKQGNGATDILRNFENLVGSAFGDTLAGNNGANRITGGGGADHFVFNSRLSTDTITDFRSTVDQLRFSQVSIHIGDGNTRVDHATTITAAGGFGTDAELVIVTGDHVSGLSRADAAAAIGSASSAYEVGDTVLFALDDGEDSALYLFTSANADAVIGAGELARIAVLSGAAGTVAADYLFVL